MRGAIALLLLAVSASAILEAEWSVFGIGKGNNIGQAITSDVTNEAFVAGTFHDTMEFIGLSGSHFVFENGLKEEDIKHVGFGELYVACIMPNGEITWGFQSVVASGIGFRVDDAMSDREGNFAITGAVSGVGKLGEFSFSTPEGTRDVFFALITREGKVKEFVQWHSKTSFMSIAGVAIDVDDYVYVSAHLPSNVTLNGTVDVSCPVQIGAESCALTVCYRPGSSKVEWYHVAVAGPESWMHPSGVTTTGTAVYTTGSMMGCVTFASMHGPQCTPKVNDTHYSEGVFIAKWDRDNSFGFVDIFPTGPDSASPQGVAITSDISGHVYISGTYRTSATFGEHRLSNDGSWDIFVVKTDGTLGGVEWAKNFGSKDEDEVGGIGIARNQRSVVVSGILRGTTVIDGKTIEVAEGMVLVQYDSDGAVEWSHAQPGPMFVGGTSYMKDPIHDNVRSLCVHGAKLNHESKKFEATIFKFFDESNPFYPVNPPEDDPTKKHGHGAAIAIVVILLLVAAGGAGAYFFLVHSKKQAGYETNDHPGQTREDLPAAATKGYDTL